MQTNDECFLRLRYAVDLPAKDGSYYGRRPQRCPLSTLNVAIRSL